MSVDTAGRVAFYLFAISVFVVFGSVTIKTKWWRTNVGANIFFLSLSFVWVAVFIGLTYAMTIPLWMREWARILVYLPFAVVLFWRAATIWWSNRGYWAWTKEDSADAD